MAVAPLVDNQMTSINERQLRAVIFYEWRRGSNASAAAATHSRTPSYPTGPSTAGSITSLREIRASMKKSDLVDLCLSMKKNCFAASKRIRELLRANWRRQSAAVNNPSSAICTISAIGKYCLNGSLIGSLTRINYAI